MSRSKIRPAGKYLLAFRTPRVSALEGRGSWSSRSRNGNAVHDGLFFQVSSDVARGRYLMEVYVRFYAFPRVDPRLGAAFLTIPDFKTRAKTQTNQSLARSIPSLSIGCTKALQQHTSGLDNRLCLVLCSYSTCLIKHPTCLPRLPDFVASFPTHSTNCSASYSSATSAAAQKPVVCFRLWPCPPPVQCPPHHHHNPASCIGRPLVHHSQTRIAPSRLHWSCALIRTPSGLLPVTREQSPLDTRDHWISSTQHPVSAIVTL